MLLSLNWNLFLTSLNMDFGFGVFHTMPFIMLQAIGLIALVLFAVLDGVKDLKREVIMINLQNKILKLEKDLEINSLKNQIHYHEESLKTVVPTVET